MEQYRFNRFQILPPVVKNLLIINVIFFLGTIAFDRTFNIDLADILGLHYFPAAKFEPYQLISYMFMHGSISHIFFNMFALWMFGSAIENFWGPKRFLIFYVFTGIGAALLHYGILYFEIRPEMSAINSFLSHPDQQSLVNIFSQKFHMALDSELKLNLDRFMTQYNNLVMTDKDKALILSVDFIKSFKLAYLNQPVVIGASGALFGILIAFGWMFPNSTIFLIFPPIPIKAKYFVIVYGLLELISGVSPNLGHDNVAHFAHVGGMLFGFILLKFWKVKHLN